MKKTTEVVGNFLPYAAVGESSWRSRGWRTIYKLGPFTAWHRYADPCGWRPDSWTLWIWHWRLWGKV